MDHCGTAAGHVARRPGSDRRQHGHADGHRDAWRTRPLQLGVLRVRLHFHGVLADWGAALGPVRPAAILPAGRRDFSPRLAFLRRFRFDAATDLFPRRAGPWRGWHHPLSMTIVGELYTL